MEKQLKIEKIRNQVKAYFEKNACHYITNFTELSEDDKDHIISIGAIIIATRHGIGYSAGSFVQSVIDNDLRGAFATADGTNLLAIRFYLMMMYNMPVNLS